MSGGSKRGRDSAIGIKRMALDKLEAYASRNGPAFYGLPVNSETITLEKQDHAVSWPEKIETGAGPVTVFDPGFEVFWKVA